MAWWNPIDYATEAVKEGASQITGNPYDTRDPRSQYYGQQKTDTQSMPGRAVVPGEVLGANTGTPLNSGGAPTAPTNTGAGSTANTAPKLDAAGIANLERQLGRTNDSIGRIGGQQQTALGNILGKYGQEKGRLDNARIDTETDYKQDRGLTTKNFAQTKERIGENVRLNTSSLQRLLGSRGAGSSSASQIMAPYAAARAGTSEQQEACTEFSTNLNALDTNWKRYDRDWKNSDADLLASRTNQERATRSGFAGKEAQLRDTLADLQSQLSVARGGGAVNSAATDALINSLLNQIDAYAKQDFGAVISAKDPNYVAPELSDYDIDTRGVEDQNQDPTQAETAAFYPIREDEEDKFLQSLYQA